MAIVLGVDVAATGEDASVVVVRDGPACVAIAKSHNPDLMQTAGWVMQLALSYGAQAVVVDADGLGVGLVARLRQDALPVVPFNGSAGSDGYDCTGTLRFRNRRAEAWWRVREALAPTAACPVEIATRDHLDELLGDLSAPRYRVVAGAKIQVESKNEIRKRLGRSPDVGDAFVYCFEGLVVPETRAAVYAVETRTQVLGATRAAPSALEGAEGTHDEITERIRALNRALYGDRETR